MRFIRTVFALIGLAVVALLGYNYWNGNGLTLALPPGTPGINADNARGDVTAAAKTTAEKAGDVASKLENSVAEGTLTAKIKAKMALDDLVKASAISVETTGTVVTLTGRVSSAAERDRAVRLAQETAGVTKVVDRLEVPK
jgi:hyperosmotically inducible protein